MFGLYIGIFQLGYLSESDESTPIETKNDEEVNPLIEEAKAEEIVLSPSETKEIDADAEISIHASREKAIESYKKRMESVKELTEQEQNELEKKCEEIRQREIISVDQEHEPVEIVSESEIVMGPPKLTRFEKARIMGARALQLSLGAPPFIDTESYIVNKATSLDISMKELEERVIPITIRRVLPNGDYQNVPLEDFKE